MRLRIIAARWRLIRTTTRRNACLPSGCTRRAIARKPSASIGRSRPAIRPITSSSTISVPACSSSGQLDDAIACAELALALQPDYASAHTNLGIVFEAQNRVEAAVAAHRRAVELDPGFAKGYSNLAVALRNAGEIDAALVASRKAITLDPDQPLGHYNHAHFLLMNGEFEEGFEEYRWRRKAKILSDGDPVFDGPEWQGEPLAGRTLLLFAEYGLGDAINFVRYVPMLAGSGGPDLAAGAAGLVSLLRPMLPDVAVFARGEPLPPFDLQLPLLSLPRIFRTTVETIPATVSYLQADAVKLARWREALEWRVRAKGRCGLGRQYQAQGRSSALAVGGRRAAAAGHAWRAALQPAEGATAGRCAGAAAPRPPTSSTSRRGSAISPIPRRRSARSIS